MTDHNDTAVMRRYTQAVTSMLLLGRRMRGGIAITAGGALDRDGRVWLAQVASESRNDVVHLEFAPDEHGVLALANLNVVIAREGQCWFQTGCTLWLPKSGSRALILPRPDQRGHFRLSPRELIHIDGKPDDVDGGMKRAEARLEQLVRSGVVTPGQMKITVLPIAA